MAVVTACASTPPQRASCSGSRVLVVHNNTRQEVDVLAYDAGREKMIGISSPGRYEFSLSDVPATARFIAKRNGNYVVSGGSNGAAARAVEFRVECR